MEKSPFNNPRLENNNVEKIGWRNIPVVKRLESALLWGREIDCLQKKLRGEAVILKKLKQDIRNSK